MKNTNFKWDNKKIFLTHWKTVYWVAIHFCIKWTFQKNAIFCPKNTFLWQKWQFGPLARAGPGWCQGTFFSLIFFYLNSEGFVGGRWRRWWNSPLNIFNLAKKWTIFGRFKKNVVKKYWNPIHRVCVTQIHHDTWFLTQFFMKMPQFLVKTVIFIIFKNPHFLLFSGVLEVKLKFQDKFYVIFDHNKCPSSEKEDEKCNLRISYFHQIQPTYHLPNCLCVLRNIRSTHERVWSAFFYIL